MGGGSTRPKKKKKQIPLLNLTSQSSTRNKGVKRRLQELRKKGLQKKVSGGEGSRLGKGAHGRNKPQTKSLGRVPSNRQTLRGTAITHGGSRSACSKGPKALRL